MKPNNSNQQNQQNQQNNQPMQGQQNQQMSGPRAAAEAELRRVEEKVDSTGEDVVEAHEKVESLQARVEELQQEKAELRDLLERTMAAVWEIDRHLTYIDEVEGSITKSYKTDPIARNAGLPPVTELPDVESDDDSEGEAVPM